MVNLNLLVTLCEDMWEKPIAEFTTAFYNGSKAAETLSLENCATFGSNNGQSVEIYEKTDDGGKRILYSCNVTEIYKMPVITSIFGKEGKVFEADYNTLYNEIGTNTELVICANIESALHEAENSIDDVKGYGILLAYINYSHNIGSYYAHMDILDSMDSDKWYNLAEAHKARIDRLEQKADTIYRSLKKTIYGNEYA